VRGAPEGTRFLLPGEARTRGRLLDELRRLYDGWGYEPVGVPALEIYDPDHPRARQAFKLTDRDNDLLALRSDFTPALAQLVSFHFPRSLHGEAPARLQYSGEVWHAINPDLARIREFTQVGIELVGVSNARADAELIHLARESVRVAGLVPRVEVGNPGFVRALLSEANVPEALQPALGDAIDRKDLSTVEALLQSGNLGEQHRQALLQVADLYGDFGVLEQARRIAPWESTIAELDRLEGILEQFEDPSELLLELGMARRLSYYTGMTFRAYTPDFGQPLLGGGRYDGALLKAAAGFSIGVERLLSARLEVQAEETPLVLCADDVLARRLRRAGVRVVRGLTGDSGEELASEALQVGAHYYVAGGRVYAAGEDSRELERLRELLAQ